MQGEGWRSEISCRIGRINADVFGPISLRFHLVL